MVQDAALAEGDITNLPIDAAQTMQVISTFYDLRQLGASFRMT